MFLRTHHRRKYGKDHYYFSVVENRRVGGGDGSATVQRQVLYLGEINTTQEAAWRQTLVVFDERRERPTSLMLFPEAQAVPADALHAVQVKLDQMQLCRPRAYGNCWLGCWLWEQLALDRFWHSRLGAERGAVPWAKVLAILVISRLIDPGSEWRLHRHGFEQGAFDELLQVDFAAAAKDRLYRCLDLLLAHKQDLFTHLHQKWKDLFHASYDVLLYDLTSTYFEGLCAQIPKAKHGYSRDGRPDCRQVVIALVLTPDGLPLAYEVMPGNTSDKTTLRDFLAKIEATYGKARRTWVMDRGIPTEETLEEMRAQGVDYLVGTPKGKLAAVHKKLLEQPWATVRQGVEVKLCKQAGELLVLAKSQGRQDKEIAMRRKKLKRLFNGLISLRRSCPNRDRLLQRLGVLKHEAGRAAGMVDIHVPPADAAVTKETFHYRLRVEKFKQAEVLDGHYLLRTSLQGESPEVLWRYYIQLTEIEAAFKTLKSDLAIRPIYHQVEPRVEAHIFVAFLAYALTATLTQRLKVYAPGLTPRAVLDKLAGIQMIDVKLPTTDGRMLLMPRYTQPEPDHQMLLEHLHLELPAQPPPRIYASQVASTRSET
jgi:transposase